MTLVCGMLHSWMPGLGGCEVSDPLTLAAVGAVALTEGIKFLYGQAGEALKRWRARQQAASAEAPVAVELPADAFEGRLHDPRLDTAGFILSWSIWRRHRQSGARAAHYRRQARYQ